MAVSQLAPRLVLDRSPRELDQANRSQSVPRFATLLATRMVISDHAQAKKLVDSLCAMQDRGLRILELATWELRSVLELEAELGLIAAEHDHNDWAVPSVESHAQNAFHGGINFLVRILSECLAQARGVDREGTKSVVECWKHLPGRIGLRLYLHAMRDAALFSPDDAVSTLLLVSEVDFWSMRREAALLLKERAGGASSALLSELEVRILGSSRNYYQRYELQPGEADWREHARDVAVWLRLKMLEYAGSLSDVGADELAAIVGRHSHLARAVEERDFFGAYISAPRWISGDPVPIAQAQDGARLQVARKMAESHDPQVREGWAAYCRSDPEGALDALSKREFSSADKALWNKLLYVLAVADPNSTQLHECLTAQALEALSRVDTQDLQPVAIALCTLILQTRRSRISKLDEWLVKLWETLVHHPEQLTDSDADLYERAVNSSAGNLTEVLLLEIEERKKAGLDPTAQQLQLLRRISGSSSAAGQLGRAVLVRRIAFLIYLDRSNVREQLGPFINADHDEGRGLRAVMLKYGRLDDTVTKEFKDAVLKGVLEWHLVDGHAANVASHIIRPALAGVMGDTMVQWGVTAAEAADILRRAHLAIRIGALEILVGWLQSGEDPEKTWSAIVVPFFENVWPREAEFRNGRLNRHLIGLVVGAGQKFPEALRLLGPYISPKSGHESLYVIDESTVPETYPKETLELLCMVCRPNGSGNFHSLSGLIDRLVAADPNLEIDRRLQWLEQQAVRI